MAGMPYLAGRLTFHNERANLTGVRDEDEEREGIAEREYFHVTTNQNLFRGSPWYAQWLQNKPRFEAETEMYSVPQQNVTVIHNMYDRREKRARVAWNGE